MLWQLLVLLFVIALWVFAFWNAQDILPKAIGYLKDAFFNFEDLYGPTIFQRAGIAAAGFLGFLVVVSYFALAMYCSFSYYKA